MASIATQVHVRTLTGTLYETQMVLCLCMIDQNASENSIYKVAFCISITPIYFYKAHLWYSPEFSAISFLLLSDLRSYPSEPPGVLLLILLGHLQSFPLPSSNVCWARLWLLPLSFRVSWVRL